MCISHSLITNLKNMFHIILQLVLSPCSVAFHRYSYLYQFIEELEVLLQVGQILDGAHVNARHTAHI